METRRYKNNQNHSRYVMGLEEKTKKSVSGEQRLQKTILEIGFGVESTKNDEKNRSKGERSQKQ